MMNRAIHFLLHLLPQKMGWLDAHLALPQYLPVVDPMVVSMLIFLFLLALSRCIFWLSADYFIRPYFVVSL